MQVEMLEPAKHFAMPDFKTLESLLLLFMDTIDSHREALIKMFVDWRVEGDTSSLLASDESIVRR